jgi:transcriptional regulator with XRE-family HTH domain
MRQPDTGTQEPAHPGTDSTWRGGGEGHRARHPGSVTVTSVDAAPLVAPDAHDVRPARDELGAFLRSRRERLSPADVGLPPGFRRRTPGLRREEVAQLAGIGVTWYTWLEQGRPINASAQVLDAIARTLRLDAAERTHLHRLAAGPEGPDGAGAGVAAELGHHLAPEIQTVLDAVTDMPACVYSSRYDLLAWNATYRTLFPSLVVAPIDERNALWHILATSGCCCRFLNRATEVPRMVATFRGAFARHMGDPAWTGFVERLSAASPEFAELWEGHDVALPHNTHKVFDHHIVGVLHLTVTSLEVSASPEARVLVYTPADEASRAGLAWLAAHPEAPACEHHQALLETAQVAAAAL